MIWWLALALAADVVPTPAQLDGAYGISDSDYPIEARRRDIVGHVEFTLAIDTEGRPSSCEITSTSWSPVLDTAACKLVMARARFKPARNAKGEAIIGSYSDWVRWDLLPVPSVWYSGYEVNVEFGAGGAVTGCTVRSIALGGGRRINDSTKCATQGNEATFAAWLGRPTAGLRSASIRTVMSSGAQDFLPGVRLRRTIAEARFDQDRSGKTVRCEMSSVSRFPGQPEGSVDLCSAGALRPTAAPNTSPIAKKRLTIEAVAVER